MRRIVVLIGLVLIIMLIWAISGWDRVMTQDAVTIKIATLAPAGSDWMKHFRIVRKEIRRKTEGRVNFKVYPGGTMGNDATVLRKIRIGQLHGASFTAGGISAVYNDFQVMSLPFFFRDYKEVDSVRTRIDPLIIKNLERKGFISLAVFDTGFVYLMSNHPIRNISSLKDRRIWIPEGDPIGTVICDEAGVPPIPLSLADVLTGLQTGLIDTVSTTTTGALALQWITKVKYITDTPLLYGYATLILSKNGYQMIPEADRTIVCEVIKRRMSELQKISRLRNIRAKETLKKMGIEFITMNSETMTEVEEFGGRVRDRLLSQDLFSKEVVSTLLNALSEYRQGK